MTPRVKPLSVLAQVGFIAAAAAAVYGFVTAARADTRRSGCTALCAMQPAYAGRDRTAPDFELPDLKGQKVRFSQYRGQTVVLNFWTKTCKPCLEEMPALAELARIGLKRKDFVVVTVSTDAGPDDVRDTLQVALNGEPPFPVLFDPDATVVAEKFGTRLYPETWIIDPQGVIRARFDGARDWSEPISLEVVELARRGGGCPIEFKKGLPRGPFAGLCTEG